MRRSTYKISRNIALFEDALAGKPISELAKKHDLSTGRIKVILRDVVRKLDHHFREMRPELNFSRYRVQSSQREFLKDKGDWIHFINLYKQHCLSIQAEETNNQQ